MKWKLTGRQLAGINQKNEKAALKNLMFKKSADTLLNWLLICLAAHLSIKFVIYVFTNIRFSESEGDGVAWLDGVNFINGIRELDIKGKMCCKKLCRYC